VGKNLAGSIIGTPGVTGFEEVRDKERGVRDREE
jgi:hypothetical protein